ncbi:MAG: sulfotransferase family 2 domain-containing protein [Rhodobacteraceae bacterium]|nr:sulfotransferase family 2 domain-containing protein [Paracoccaceae bacterium]
MNQRTIILHYHLFKNAGTSVDRILQKNFGSSWVTREFPMTGGDNSAMVTDWILSQPDAIAFSSHTMMGPIPNIKGVTILSIAFLRDPISRIISAYNFERNQRAETTGAHLAKVHDLEGYVRARLATRGDRQCRNFQVYRLASLAPGPGLELDRATSALERLSFLGRVEDFGNAISRLADLLKRCFPHFAAEAVHANVSEKAEIVLSDEIASLLEQSNREDRILLDRFHALFVASRT